MEKGKGDVNKGKMEKGLKKKGLFFFKQKTAYEI